MRAQIQDLPDGVYRARDYLDNDGIVDEALPLDLSISVSGDRMTLDFTGSAPACLGPVNIARSTTVAACYVAMKHVFPEVPANAGVLEPIDFVIPDGPFWRRSPRPVGGYRDNFAPH